ncbi:MAG: quinolinate synthase NadA [Roseburia sp.]|nr:quinolinate synthase NadA [Roseburia sp.]
MNELKNKIDRLKEEKNAVILAHYYVSDEVQEIADYVGDSFYLSQIAARSDARTIVFCGVSFMGESAKILSPEKTVLMPDATADCPMAHMAEEERIRAMKEKYDDLAVVCYINSTAELKKMSDVCVTSSNAVKIVKALPNQNIFFIPDENLGRYVAEQVPEKNIMLNDGYCPVHAQMTVAGLEAAKLAHPEAEVLSHPECTKEILDRSDYIGSTSGIIDYAGKSNKKEFIICTETGVFYELVKNNPDKAFYPVMKEQICSDMKKITLEKVADVLEKGSNEVFVSDELRFQANKPLTNMLELGR